MKIGELAKRAGVSVDTLRFWEKEGLISAERGTNGYRYYGDDSLITLQFILSMKSLGFSLGAIAELLAVRVEKDSHTCAEVKSLAEAHLADVEQRLAQLTLIRRALGSMINACCGGNEAASHCSILEALEADELAD